jgi:hypothetical protein
MTQKTLEQGERPAARLLNRNIDPYFNPSRPKRTETFFSPHFATLPAAYESPKGPGPQPRR